jgi:hypothetical protein
MYDSANPVIHGDEIKYTRSLNEYRSGAWMWMVEVSHEKCCKIYSDWLHSMLLCIYLTYQIPQFLHKQML